MTSPRRRWVGALCICLGTALTAVAAWSQPPPTVVVDHPAGVARLSIDKGGIGMQMTENLCRSHPQVVGENFTNESKERWATDFKILLQHGHVVLPRERSVIGQIHSIKRTVTPSGKVAFDSERTGEGHADQFWAIALACQKERALPKKDGPFIKFTVVGGSKNKTETFI